MPNYRIPEKFIHGFIGLASLSNEQFGSLLQSLQSLRKGASPKEVTDRIGESIKDVPNNSKIARSIFSLGSVLNSNEIESVKLFAQEFADFVFDVSKKDFNLELSTESKLKLPQYLQGIIEHSFVIKNSYKAITIITDNHAIFREAKVYSDIRLVFNDDIYDSDRIAVIVNQLKIEYNVNGENNNIFFSLDENDLISLKKSIERALEKNSIIKADYAQIKFMNVAD